MFTKVNGSSNKASQRPNIIGSLMAAIGPVASPGNSTIKICREPRYSFCLSNKIMFVPR